MVHYKTKTVPIMGNCSDEGKETKTEKLSPPSTPDVSSYPVYPDWPSLQAFYGDQVAMLPYLNSAATSSPATPPYIWAPSQSMVTPYGAPYAAFYAHFPHPGVPMVVAAPSLESPVKSSGVSDEGFVKKDKEVDPLTMSIGNTNAHSNEFANEHQMSDSEATNGSSGGSASAVRGAAKVGQKRILEESPNEDVKVQKVAEISAAKFRQANNNLKEVISPGDAPKNKLEDNVIDLDMKNVKPSPPNLSQLPSETWNERELKRERRKQSNRESARRSRLRKQAEAEGLAIKVQALTCDNMNLKTEFTKLLESSSTLKLENAALMVRLDARLRETKDARSVKKPVTTVNLLERVNNSSGENDDREVYESRSPRAKLHQLLDASPRTDAVAAS